jgi:hypothetical protein
MAIFKPKPMAKPVMAPRPVAAKPIIAPRPVAPKPIAAKPVMAPPTTQPMVGKKDAFYKSPEYKGFQKDSAGKPATMDMYNSPYFGSVGSGSVGRAQDAAYRKYKGIAEPTPVGGPVGTSPAPIGVGHSSFYNSLMGGRAAPSQPVMGNNIGAPVKPSPVTFQSGMQSMAKGGMTASRRGDGIAAKGKTKGRMV